MRLKQRPEGSELGLLSWREGYRQRGVQMQRPPQCTWPFEKTVSKRG